MLEGLKNFANEARVTIGQSLAKIEPKVNYLPFVSTVINIIEFVPQSILWAAKDHWKPSQESTPLLHHIATKDWKRSLAEFVPILGNIYVICQDTRSHLEHRKSQALAEEDLTMFNTQISDIQEGLYGYILNTKTVIVNDEKVFDTKPHFCENVHSSTQLSHDSKCGDYALYKRGREKCISICLTGKIVGVEKCIDSFSVHTIETNSKKYYILSKRNRIGSRLTSVYSSLVFPNIDRIVSHITNETCVKFGVTSTNCKVGDILVDPNQYDESSNEIVRLKLDSGETELLTIDKLRDALRDGKVQGPAVEKFIEIWQTTIDFFRKIQPNT